MKAIEIDLLEALDKERTRRGLDHKGFSTLLKISESYWCMIRKGDRRLTPNLAVSFMQELPEITVAVGNFVMGKGNDGQNQNDPPKSRAVTPTFGELSSQMASTRQKSLKKGM